MQCSKCKKTIAREDNLKKHKCKPDVFGKETICFPDSNETAPDDVITEQPTDKAPADVLPSEAPPADESSTEKIDV